MKNKYKFKTNLININNKKIYNCPHCGIINISKPCKHYIKKYKNTVHLLTTTKKYKYEICYICGSQINKKSPPIIATDYKLNHYQICSTTCHNNEMFIVNNPFEKYPNLIRYSEINQQLNIPQWMQFTYIPDNLISTLPKNVQLQLKKIKQK